MADVTCPNCWSWEAPSKRTTCGTCGGPLLHANGNRVDGQNAAPAPFIPTSQLIGGGGELQPPTGAAWAPPAVAPQYQPVPAMPPADPGWHVVATPAADPWAAPSQPVNPATMPAPDPTWYGQTQAAHPMVTPAPVHPAVMHPPGPDWQGQGPAAYPMPPTAYGYAGAPPAQPVPPGYPGAIAQPAMQMPIGYPPAPGQPLPAGYFGAIAPPTAPSPTGYAPAPGGQGSPLPQAPRTATGGAGRPTVTLGSVARGFMKDGHFNWTLILQLITCLEATATFLVMLVESLTSTVPNAGATFALDVIGLLFGTALQVFLLSLRWWRMLSLGLTVLALALELTSGHSNQMQFSEGLLVFYAVALTGSLL